MTKSKKNTISDTFAMVVPDLDLIIPFVGNTAGMVISFVLPGLLHAWAHWDDWREELPPGWRWTLVGKDAAIVLFGAFGMIAGLYANINQMRTRL